MDNERPEVYVFHAHVYDLFFFVYFYFFMEFTLYDYFS
jgi:hypothetical protein